MCCFLFFRFFVTGASQNDRGGYVMLSISETSRFFASLRMTGALNCLKLNIFLLRIKHIGKYVLRINYTYYVNIGFCKL